MECLFVVDRDLFTRLDIPQREKQHVPVERPHVSIRPAAMIDVVSAVAAARSVQTPAAVDVTDAQDAAFARALLRFQIRNSFPGVFGNLLASLEMNIGEAAFAVYGRLANREAASEFHQVALYDEISPQRSQRKTSRLAKAHEDFLHSSLSSLCSLRSIDPL